MMKIALTAAAVLMSAGIASAQTTTAAAPVTTPAATSHATMTHRMDATTHKAQTAKKTMKVMKSAKHAGTHAAGKHGAGTKSAPMPIKAN